MKFFVDTANLAQIKEANDLGILDGVTTNPSLMAKEGIKARDRKKQAMVARYAAKRTKLKEEGDFLGLQKFPKSASPVRLHNRCMISGRPRGFMRQFGISRVLFRKMASEGKIPGVTKGSW